ncbi:aldo/keto reductase [Hymenobacter lapidiphilus]|uniref:Aldo/keto reductase n=1 Tax=Hymenobacter lapidiphilus TaxID=2608003 RepID=A0A7Y7PRK4_9BACT|nr:aldo/keto reductase [Hymenobacter lapidiphilus]NVO32703.1 aldo/keto reductase [Hymenobacter lapidiphilus]
MASLTTYRALGRSGLLISPLTLGTMTFGTARWGAAEPGARAIFNAYVEAGGNSIDTADVYSGGTSEELVGRFVAEGHRRDELVLATKFGFSAQKGNPNAGGNGRKQIHRALEGSLRRLGTDYIDLYWLHVWDQVTPAEEVLQTLGDLVRAGKIRYFGLSDMPAWYATQLATLARAHAVPGPVAMQLEYSLVARTLETEYVPAARACGLGIMPWSPLAGGFLAGKYEPSAEGTQPAGGEGRLSGSNPFSGPFTKFTARNWQILAALREVAGQLDRPLAQVALAWTLARPGITSTLIGASRPAQVPDNLAALGISFSPDQLAALNHASAPEAPEFFSAGLKQAVFGGVEVQGWE